MRKFFSTFFVLSVFALSPLAVHADIISTFTLNATTTDGYISGSLEIDTTTGQAGYGTFTEVMNVAPGVIPIQSYTIGGLFGPTFCGANCMAYPNNQYFNLAGPNGFLNLQTNTSLVGYTGGLLCGGQSYCAGAGYGSAFIAINAISGLDRSQLLADGSTLNPVSTVTTPEPSTLVFVGTGALGLLGAARRKFFQA